MNNFQIKKLTKSNFSEIVYLLKKSFNMKSTNAFKLLSWKFFDKNYKTNLTAYGAFTEGKLVSFYCNKKIDIKYNNKTLNTAICLDMATSPDFRGQGLISQVSKPVYKDILRNHYDFSFGFSNDNGLKVDQNSHSYGYKIIGPIVKYFTLPVLVNPYTISKIDNLSKSNITLPYFHLPLTKEFLKWRYISKPENNYQFVSISKNNVVISEVVILNFPYRLEVFKIIPKVDDAIHQTLSALRGYAFKIGKPIVTVRILENKFWSKNLKLSGYIRMHLNEKLYHLTVKPHPTTKLVQKALDSDSWFIMGGDII